MTSQAMSSLRCRHGTTAAAYSRARAGPGGARFRLTLTPRIVTNNQLTIRPLPLARLRRAEPFGECGQAAACNSRSQVINPANL